MDNNGNSLISDQVHIGQPNAPNRVQIMPELPMNFFISFPGADQTAGQINLVLGYGGEGVQQNPAKALFRNITLAPK